LTTDVRSGNQARSDEVPEISDGADSPTVEELRNRGGIEFAPRNPEAAGSSLRQAK
jgi:hypothetical protein